MGEMQNIKKKFERSVQQQNRLRSLKRRLFSLFLFGGWCGKKREKRKRVRERVGWKYHFPYLHVFRIIQNGGKYYIIVNNQSIINHEGIRQGVQTQQSTHSAAENHKQHTKWDERARSKKASRAWERIIHLSFAVCFWLCADRSTLFVEYLKDFFFVCCCCFLHCKWNNLNAAQIGSKQSTWIRCCRCEAPFSSAAYESLRGFWREEKLSSEWTIFKL